MASAERGCAPNRFQRVIQGTEIWLIFGRLLLTEYPRVLEKAHNISFNQQAVHKRRGGALITGWSE